MPEFLTTIYQLLQTYSFIHRNNFFLIFSLVITNYFLVFCLYSITTKKYNRLLFYCVYLPIFIVIKLIFGTTLFTTFTISIPDLISLSLSFLLVFLLEFAYLRVAFSSYHEAKKNQLNPISPMLDAYIVSVISFTLSFLSFYPI